MTGQVNRAGMTFVQFLIALAMLLILLAVYVVSLRQSSLTAMHDVVCKNNLKRWGLAILNYESNHMKLPMGVGVKDQNGVLQTQPLSGFVSVLPFVGVPTLYQDIATPKVIDGVEYPAFGVGLSNSDYVPWATQVDVMICPAAKRIQSKSGRASYAFSIGDVARNVSQQETLRGAYGYFKANRLSNITDGLSNTVSLVEIGGGTIKSTNGGCLVDGKAAWLDNPAQVFTVVKNGNDGRTIGRGSHWADGRAGVGLANTILLPNSPSFQVQGSPTSDGIYSAGSMHVGGANVGLIDGSVRFITDLVDAGDPSTPTLTVEQLESEDGLASPHGVWGAFGTIASGEDEELYKLRRR